MIENILTKKQASLRVKLTVKTLISTAIIILAVVLPQIAHAAAGAQAGITLLPMYLPVLLGGCLLGPVWGLGVGVLSPLASFLITSALGTPMLKHVCTLITKIKIVKLSFILDFFYKTYCTCDNCML